ncbi:MAG: hypothetical protein ACFE89_04590 [Candidatus Hodarchaeota archaeon]
MTYGELSQEVMRWATDSITGLKEEQIPETLVLTPFKVDQIFSEFLPVIKAENLRYQEVKCGFLLRSKDKQVLFCRTGIGASIFADIANVFCNCQNTKTILFVGTGAGLSDKVQTVDINIPPSCLRLDKVLEILFPQDVPAIADSNLAKYIQTTLEDAMADLDITIHNQLHATVPFLTCETKSFLLGLQRQGVYTVDMELSVLYALTHHYNLRSAGIIRVGDLPLHGLPMWKSQDQKVELKRQVHTKILQAILRCTLF